MTRFLVAPIRIRGKLFRIQLKSLRLLSSMIGPGDNSLLLGGTALLHLSDLFQLNASHVSFLTLVSTLNFSSISLHSTLIPHSRPLSVPPAMILLLLLIILTPRLLLPFPWPSSFCTNLASSSPAFLLTPPPCSSLTFVPVVLCSNSFLWSGDSLNLATYWSLSLAI